MLTLEGIHLATKRPRHDRARALQPGVKLFSADGLEGLIRLIVVIPLLQIAPPKQILGIRGVRFVSEGYQSANLFHGPITPQHPCLPTLSYLMWIKPRAQQQIPK